MDAMSPTFDAPRGSVNRTIALLLPPQLALTMIWMGVLQVLLPTQVAAIDAVHKVENLGFITGLAAIFAAACNPLAGALSDRTRSRFGRRAPWLVGTAALTLLGMALQGQARDIAMLTAALCVVQCATSGFQAVLSAVMPERVPVERRGLASSVIGMGLPLGAVIGTAVASRFLADLSMGYEVLGGFLFACALVFVVLQGDPAPPSTQVPRADVSATRALASFFSVMSAADFRWTFVSRFLCLMTFSLPAGFGLYLLQDHIRLAEGHSAASVLVTLSVVQMGCMTLSTLIGGPLSDWLGGRRRVFVWCAALGMALALMLPPFMPTETGMLAFAACNGFAFGVYLAVDAALVTQVLPDENNVARDLGILNIANAGPQIIAPFVGAQVIAFLGGYNALLVAAALCAIGSALAILPVRGVR